MIVFSLSIRFDASIAINIICALKLIWLNAKHEHHPILRDKLKGSTKSFWFFMEWLNPLSSFSIDDCHMQGISHVSRE